MKQMIAYLERYKEKSYIVSALQVVIASIFLALLGQVKIMLPFSPVPIVLQSKMVLLVGAFFGARKGMLATTLFLMYGAIGLPVFSSGHYGYLSFFGPTGGYILVYPLATYLVGYIIERLKTLSLIKVMTAYCLGLFAVIYPVGCLQLSWFIGIDKAFLLGAAPFAIPDLLVLIGFAVTSLPILKKLR